MADFLYDLAIPVQARYRTKNRGERDVTIVEKRTYEMPSIDRDSFPAVILSETGDPVLRWHREALWVELAPVDDYLKACNAIYARLHPHRPAGFLHQEMSGFIRDRIVSVEIDADTLGAAAALDHVECDGQVYRRCHPIVTIGAQGPIVTDLCHRAENSSKTNPPRPCIPIKDAGLVGLSLTEVATPWMLDQNRRQVELVTFSRNLAELAGLLEARLSDFHSVENIRSAGDLGHVARELLTQWGKPNLDSVVSRWNSFKDTRSAEPLLGRATITMIDLSLEDALIWGLPNRDPERLRWSALPSFRWEAPEYPKAPEIEEDDALALMAPR